MRTILASLILVLVCLVPFRTNASQIVAGTAEDKMFQRITAETDAGVKLQAVMEFERQFPQSRALADVYLVAVDLYRIKADRNKIIEYGEKALTLDQDNITAMMVLSRNYAIERKNLDRAVELAQRAVDRINTLKGNPRPAHQSEAQWKIYLQDTEAAARNILGYAENIRGQ